MVIRDVTEERDVQQRIQQQDRLAAMGQLAGGIAHDFNNFLTTIMLYAQMGLGKRDLPPDLVAGFRATLEEIDDASVLLHVADISNPHVEQHIESVREILGEIGLGSKPECVILNKSDLLGPRQARRIAGRLGGVAVSALRGDGLEAMLETVEALVYPEEAEYDAVAAARGV